MPRTWLYPVSPTSGYYFAAGNRRWPDTSPESFVEMIRAGAGDEMWSIRTNYRNVQVGDGVAIYATQHGARPPFIIGLASIVEPPEWNENLGRHEIRIKVDREVSLRLAEFPIDATYLKERLPAQKAGVVSLSPGLVRWIYRRIGVRTAFAKDAKQQVREAITVQKVRVRGKDYEAVLRHDPLVVEPLRRKLRRAQWDILTGAVADLEADLVARSPDARTVLLVEAKTIKPNLGRTEIRYAIGQLFDYEYFVLPSLRLKNTTRVQRLIILEHKPASALIEFVESLEIGIAWIAQRSIAAGPNTKRWLERLV